MLSGVWQGMEDTLKAEVADEETKNLVENNRKDDKELLLHLITFLLKRYWCLSLKKNPVLLKFTSMNFT